jgi:rod shape-determining protein MreC
VIESSFHRTAYINSSNKIVGSMLDKKNQLYHFINLKKENDSLASENARLLGMQPFSFISTLDTFKIKTDSTKRVAFKYIAAEVINNEVDKINNYIILNKGLKNGVQKNMGVICDKGVVGIVKEVSDDFCLVISELNSKLRVSVRVGNGNFVSMFWEGYDATSASINDLPKHIKIKKNDTVFTSGESWFFPPKLMVGTVKDFELKNGKNFYEIKVKLSTDFYNLNRVYIVQSLLRNQTDSLIAKIHD